MSIYEHILRFLPPLPLISKSLYFKGFFLCQKYSGPILGRIISIFYHSTIKKGRLQTPQKEGIRWFFTHLIYFIACTNS